MTPVGSDQPAGLSVASCGFSLSYAKEGCKSSPGLVVEMEPHFWTLDHFGDLSRLESVRDGEGALRTGSRRALSGQYPRICTEMRSWTLWHTERRECCESARWKWPVNRFERRSLRAKSLLILYSVLKTRNRGSARNLHLKDRNVGGPGSEDRRTVLALSPPNPPEVRRGHYF